MKRNPVVNSIQKFFSAILSLTGLIVGIYAIFQPEKGQEILLYSAPFIFCGLGITWMHEIDRIIREEKNNKEQD